MDDPNDISGEYLVVRVATAPEFEPCKDAVKSSENVPMVFDRYMVSVPEFDETECREPIDVADATFDPM